VGEILQFRTADTSTLRAALKQLLSSTGSVEQRIEDSQFSPSVWRSVARAAARELGRPVQTLEMHGILHASLRDWPANTDEEAIHEAALRRAMNGLKF
jgi:hypothetical protein